MEQRIYPRITASFPLRITPDILGEAVDISETGLGFILEKPLLLSKVTAEIEVSPKESIETEFKVIWNKHLVAKNRFTYGVCFIRLKEKDLAILKNILTKPRVLNDNLVRLTQKFKGALECIKNEFDAFDKANPDKDDQIAFLEERKKEIFKQFDFYFSRVWKIIEYFDKTTYKLHQEYCQKTMAPLLEEGIEINKHLYRKPFGYPGDYVMMNYIYNYHDKNYLGDTSYQRLLNNYACNISISKSNIIRKDFLKGKILEVIKTADKPTITSIGSGPARELIELLKENKINKNIEFVCLDFEKKALDYVKNQIDVVDEKRRKNLKIEYIHKNIIDFIKNKENDKHFDLIYVSGVFDYLSDRICFRLTKKLYDLLNKDAVLVICNASSENFSHRAYYEFLGNWIMIHRTKEEMLAWTKEFDDIEEIRFEQPVKDANYLFLSIKKL